MIFFFRKFKNLFTLRFDLLRFDFDFFKFSSFFKNQNKDIPLS